MRSKLKGYFMLFRILPVLVWSFTCTLIGTALAVLDNSEIDWIAFLIVLTTAALIQGYPTHIMNEIVDWKSGADGRELREKKSGGSKVLQAKLLNMQDLWRAFIVSHILLLGLLAACYIFINARIIYYFIIPGYLSGLLYSLPPFRFSYRPFLGEWLSGFAGIFLLVLGSYFAQTSSLNTPVFLIAFGLGLTYIAIMLFFHYLDFESDQLASPVKNTTIVFLGLKASRVYVYCLLTIAFVVFLGWTFLFRIEGIILLVLSLILIVSHNRANLDNAMSLIKWGKVITYSTLLAGIGFAFAAKQELLLMLMPVTVGFLAYKKFGKLYT